MGVIGCALIIQPAVMACATASVPLPALSVTNVVPHLREPIVTNAFLDSLEACATGAATPKNSQRTVLSAYRNLLALIVSAVPIPMHDCPIATNS